MKVPRDAPEVFALVRLWEVRRSVLHSIPKRLILKDCEVIMFLGGGKIVCPKCGRVWELTKHNLIARDPDSVECKCGHVLHKWNGAVFYEARLVKGLPEDEEKN